MLPLAGTLGRSTVGSTELRTVRAVGRKMALAEAGRNSLGVHPPQDSRDEFKSSRFPLLWEA